MADTSWLDNVDVDRTAMSEVKKSITKWRELYRAMFQAQAAYEKAKEKYETFVADEMIRKLRTNGMESITLEDGTVVSVCTNTKCSQVKDKQLRKNVAAWLKERGMESMVKEELIVMPSNKAALDKLGIAYDENTDVNTNSLKAYILSEMRLNNLTAQDLPKGISWYQWDDINVQSPL